MYCEETDWCWRLPRVGHQVHYVPSASVYHVGGQSTRLVPVRNQARLQYSKARLSRKRFGILKTLPVAAAGGIRVVRNCVSDIGRSLVGRRAR
jgi:GT2 family glycosyltransferase